MAFPDPYRFVLPSRPCFPESEALKAFFALVLVWLTCTSSFIIGLPSLGSSVAFSAATSIATIGLYISYGTRF
jgi:hypothetical protein